MLIYDVFNHSPPSRVLSLDRPARAACHRDVTAIAIERQ